MTPRISHGPVGARSIAGIIPAGLCLAALAVSGCSDPTLKPKDTVPGTQPGSSLAPGGTIKPNAPSARPAATAEPA